MEHNPPPYITSSVALIIPALDPGQGLVDLLKTLSGWDGPVLVVDDGSGPDAQPVFAQATRLGALVLRHSANLGKGAALKTAFSHCLTDCTGLVGCVTADADGQHRPQDILRVAQALRQNPNTLVLGCRTFSGPDVPARSRWGNRFSGWTLRLCGVRVQDSQTGLRGIPEGFLPVLAALPGARYEYETEMLLAAKRRGVSLLEVPIETVYLDQNRSSHFRPVRDAFRVFLPILQFSAASLVGAGVDWLGYLLILSLLGALPRTTAIWAATVAARLLSAGVNYLCNRHLVFRGGNKNSGARYLLLCVLQMAASAFLVSAVVGLTRLPSPLCKPVVDVALFFLSYRIQRRWVFRTDEFPERRDGA